MSENSKIEWTDHTFNPWIGCTKISPGCKHCYAERLAQRYRWTKWGYGESRRLASDAYWSKPLKWNSQAIDSGTRPRVFCASLADVFDQEVPDEWRDRLFDLIYRCSALEWLILTKRPKFANRWLFGTSGAGQSLFVEGGILEHVRIGTSAENQGMWDKRIDSVCEFPSSFVSAEPLLGPIEIGLHKPGWVIVGGESGPGARPMAPDWARSLRDQCVGAGIPFLFKQWGGINKKATGRVLDGKEWNQFPETVCGNVHTS